MTNSADQNQTELSSLTLPVLTDLLKQWGEPGYRASQLYGWLHQKQVDSFEQMTNLPAGLRRRLMDECRVAEVRTVERQSSQLDATNKFLLRLWDGNCVEAVYMEYKHGPSLCISTQVGCRQGCAFCASTLGGLVRGLSAGEMLGELYEVQRQMGKRVDSIVLMGIGEPLDNFDNLVDFLTILSSPQGQGMSLRHLSLSTCGLVPQMRRLMELRLGLTLSVSLHASDDETRSRIMPINRQYPLGQLMETCRDYFAVTGRRISYEYALIAGVNDSAEQADALARLLAGQNCHVNLIPVNPVKERNTQRSGNREVQHFAQRLCAKGINATVRRELGSDISAACGQLRRQHIMSGKE